jgi:hypothetical protein
MSAARAWPGARSALVRLSASVANSFKTLERQRIIFGIQSDSSGKRVMIASVASSGR